MIDKVDVPTIHATRHIDTAQSFLKSWNQFVDHLNAQNRDTELYDQWRILKHQIESESLTGRTRSVALEFHHMMEAANPKKE